MGLPETHISWGTAVLKRTQHRLNLFDPVVITTIIWRMIVSASNAGWGAGCETAGGTIAALLYTSLLTAGPWRAYDARHPGGHGVKRRG